jgi:hypothetical protein
VESLKANVAAIAALRGPRMRALLDLEHAYLRFCEDDLSGAAALVASAFAHDPSLGRDPAPLGYFLSRWECDFFHPRLTAEDYRGLGARLRANGQVEPPAGNFSLWLLSALPDDFPQAARRELTRLVSAVQFVAAAQRHREARARGRALSILVDAFRTYPNLLAGRTPGSLLSHTVQPATVAAWDRLRRRG